MCLFVIFYVLLVYMFVKDVALLRDESGFADLVSQIAFVRTRVRTGG
jgi:hypothetical protein